MEMRLPRRVTKQKRADMTLSKAVALPQGVPLPRGARSNAVRKPPLEA